MTDLATQITDALADMRSKVSFDPVEHVYTRKSDGKWLPGCSTISEILPKPFLVAWAAKMAVQHLGYHDDGCELAETMLARIKAMTVEEYKALLTEAKAAHRNKSKTALTTGTDGHKTLEEWTKAAIAGAPRFLPIIGPLGRAFRQFLEWEEGVVQEWIASEALIYNEEKEYAGTLDAIAIVSGEPAVIDFKFAQSRSDSWAIQTAGYCSAFDRYGIKIRKRLIVRLPKTEFRDVWNRKARKYEQKPNDLEVIEIDTPFDFDFETFLACRQVLRWLNYVKEKHNE